MYVSATGPAPALRDDLGGGRLFEHETTVGTGVDNDRVARLIRALQHLERDRVGDLPLQHALERARPEVGVVARLRDPLLRRGGELERETALRQPGPEDVDLQADDPLDLVLGQAAEYDDLVDAIE